jgi:prevent-host-death family protein
MERIGIRELRDNLTSTIRRVRAGEAFEVTHDGEPVAILSPVKHSRLDELIAAGQVTMPKRPLQIPRERFKVTGDRTVSEILDEQRADRL